MAGETATASAPHAISEEEKPSPTSKSSRSKPMPNRTGTNLSWLSVRSFHVRALENHFTGRVA